MLKVSSNGKDTVGRFVEQIQGIYGQHLRSIVLFGSTVSGDFAPGVSDYNVLVVLGRVTWAELVKLSPLLPRGSDPGSLAPVLVSSPDLAEAARVSPMHYLDIKEHGKVLVGEDVPASLDLSAASSGLLFHCEYELHRARNEFRMAYVATADRVDGIRRLLTRAWSRDLSIARHLLRLSGHTPPLSKMESLEVLKPLASLKVEPFRAIQRVREDPWASPPKGWANVVEEYMGQLNRLVDYAKTLHKASSMSPS